MKSEKTTNDINIIVEPEYLESQSQPSDGYFVWSYHITIANKGSQTIQLLRRHWKIINETGQMQEVEGDGVVGVQPVLEPGQEFEYTSGTYLTTPSGVMMGSYQMLDEHSESMFSVEIPAFSLDCPDQSNQLLIN
jgi:ApaG protein